MTTTTDGQALLRAVLERPGDDLPRLVYADWLQEHEQDDVAEMIRWGVAHPESTYACMGDSSVGQGCGGDTVCPTCQMLEQVLRVPQRVLGEDAYKVRRGFIAEVRCTLAAFVGGPCDMPWGPPGTTCHKCDGTGTVEGVARRLFQSQPVTAVTLVDREPSHPNGGTWGHCTWGEYAVIDHYPDSPEDDRPALVPSELMDKMAEANPESVTRTQFGRWIACSTRAAALAALSDAAVAYGRGLANLTKGGA